MFVGHLCELVKAIFDDQSRVGDINHNLISLIPKSVVVSSMKHFHPIGLCNVSYEAMTKLVAHRIRDFLPDMVGSAQCAFIPKRQGQDNIIVS